MCVFKVVEQEKKTESTRFLENAIWQYFTYDFVKKYAVCKIDGCGAHVKSKMPSNLSSHIKFVHKNVADVVLDKIKESNVLKKGIKRKADPGPISVSIIYF